jgi:hypothetical protein
MANGEPPLNRQQFSEEDRPEVFSFISRSWDIKQAKQMVANRKPSGTIPVKAATGFFPMLNIDAQHAANVDLKRPVIGVKVDGGVLPIDGWHRLHRAHSEGVESLPMHVLS